VAGRFKPCELRDISGSAFKSNEYYTDDDFVAVIFDVPTPTMGKGGRCTTVMVSTVFYGVIEKMVYAAEGKRQENIFLLHCDDKNGLLRIRFLEEVKNDRNEQKRENVRGKKGKGGLLFSLPLAAKDGVSDKVTVESVICVVDLQLKKEERVYVLKPQDEQVVKAFHTRWKAAKSDADREGIRKARPKMRPKK
jgi:hypothetical protein